MPRRALALAVLALIGGVALLYAARSQVPPAIAAPTSSSSLRAEQTKPPGLGTQPQLPLVTSVRWAVDRRSTGALLVLLYQGYASSFRVVDASGATVVQVPIAGSGIFGADSCVGSGQPGENVTWVGIDQPTLEAFMQRYATYSVIAAGIPAGEVTLPLSDSGCRGGS